MSQLKIISFFIILAGLFSCKKVIDIQVNSSDTKYVVEGIVTNEPGSCRVYLSQSKPFYEDNNFLPVSGAVVTVKDNGIEVPLPEISPGVYAAGSITGTPGHVYQLFVKVSGMEFKASSTMP